MNTVVEQQDIQDENQEELAKVLYMDERLESLRQSDKSYLTAPQSQQLQYRTDKVLRRIREIFRPTLESIQYEETIKEINQRVYQRLLKPVNRYNRCITKVFDEQDYIKCDEDYLQEMENDVIEWSKKIAKDCEQYQKFCKILLEQKLKFIIISNMELQISAELSKKEDRKRIFNLLWIFFQKGFWFGLEKEYGTFFSYKLLFRKVLTPMERLKLIFLKIGEYIL